MSNDRYKKIYPFEKSVFVAKLMERIVPVDFRERMKRPLGRKLEGRMFVGEIGNEYFRIVTYPDQWESVRHPFGGIRKVPIWKNPSCIYGKFHECDGQTVVDCTVDIYVGSKIMSVSGILMSCFGALACMISVIMEGFTPNVLLAVGIFTLIFIRSISALQPHQSEHDVLIKFMEDLEN